MQGVVTKYSTPGVTIAGRDEDIYYLIRNIEQQTVSPIHKITAGRGLGERTIVRRKDIP
jgi:hypothetical protein